MIEHHKHRTGVALRITTHTAGQNFGTFARVSVERGGRSKSGPALHETEVYGFGAEGPATEAARRWIDRQERIQADEDTA